MKELGYRETGVYDSFSPSIRLILLFRLPPNFFRVAFPIVSALPTVCLSGHPTVPTPSENRLVHFSTDTMSSHSSVSLPPATSSVWLLRTSQSILLHPSIASAPSPPGPRRVARPTSGHVWAIVLGLGSSRLSGCDSSGVRSRGGRLGLSSCLGLGYTRGRHWPLPRHTTLPSLLLISGQICAGSKRLKRRGGSISSSRSCR